MFHCFIDLHNNNISHVYLHACCQVTMVTSEHLKNVEYTCRSSCFLNLSYTQIPMLIYGSIIHGLAFLALLNSEE